MTMLLALDPGKTTGWSIWSFEKEKPLKLIDLGQTEGGVDGYLSQWWDKKTWCEVIVSEQFVLDGRTPNPDITPLKIEGVLMAYVKQFGGKLVFQRNNFKKHVSNDMLKQHELYHPGKPHAMDSIRHALAWGKVTHHMPTLQKYFMLN